MNPKLAIALIALTLPLAGCGNKGPLVMASPPAPEQAPATAAGEVPVEIAPDPIQDDVAPEPTTDPAGFEDVEPDPDPTDPEPATDDGNG